MAAQRSLLKIPELIGESRFLLFASLIERIFFFVFFLIVARQFTVEDYGMMITAFTIANVSAILFDLGIPIHLQREIAAGNKAEKLFPPVLSLNTLLLPLFFAISMVAGIYFYNIEAWTMALISIPVFLFSISNILSKALAGFGDFRSQFNSVLYPRALNMVAVLTAFYFSSGLDSYLITLSLFALLQAVILARRLSLHLSLRDAFGFSIGRIRELYSVIPLGGAVAFNFLYDKIDILIITKLLGFHESAIYSVSYGLYKTATFSFAFLLIPALTKLTAMSSRMAAFRLLLAKYTWHIFLICLITTAALYFLAGPVVSIAYGEKYEESKAYLKILSAAMIGIGLNNLFGVALNGLGLYRQNLYVTLIGLAVNIAMNLVLIPGMGILGAVIATIATEYLVLALDSHYISKHFSKTL